VQHSVLLERSFKSCLELSHLNDELFINHRLLDVDWVLNWNFDLHFNRYFHSLFNLDRRSVDIDWPIDIDRFLDYGRSGNLNGPNHLLLNFSDYLHRNFLLHFYVFWYFYNFLYNPLRPRHKFRDLHYYFNWLLYNHFFYYLLRYSWLQLFDLVLSLFQQFSS